MQDEAVILAADRGQRVRAAIPAVILIVCLSVIALWLSIAFGPVGLIGMILLIAAGLVVFFMRTTSVALSVTNDAVIVRNTLRTTRVPLDNIEGMALTPDGELQVLTKKRGVVVEAADGRAEEEVAAAAEQTMDEVDRRAGTVVPVSSPYADDATIETVETVETGDA